MKKWVMWSLAGVAFALLVGLIVYMIVAPSLVIVPPQNVAVLIPEVEVDSGVPQVVFIGLTTVPLDLSEDQSVVNNIVVTFSEPMDPQTVNENTFWIMGPGNSEIKGVISSDTTRKVWTFNPNVNLQYNTIYGVTVTKDAKGISGNSLVRNFVWTFTTYSGSSGGGGGSSSSESVTPILTTITLSPLSANISVAGTQQLVPTLLDQFGAPIDVTVTYASSNVSVANVSSSGLVTALAIGNTTITATNGAIGGASIIYVAEPLCPAVSVDLGTSGDFAILSKSQITTTGVTSIIGDLGISPAAASFIEGFGLVLDATECFSTSSLVTGSIYASDYNTLDCTTPAKMTTAISDLETAYTTGNGLASCDTELGDGNLGGLTIPSGVHKFSTDVIIPTDVYLEGGATEVWVFQIAGTLDISAATTVHLTGGALAKNVYWLVAGTTTLETTSTFNGNIISGPGDAGIALQNGAVLNGRALGQKEVTLIANNVTKPSA